MICACGQKNPPETVYCQGCGRRVGLEPTMLATEASTSSDPLIGTTLDGRYRIDAVLGEGGMGVVYRAMNVRLQQPVALKVLAPQLSLDAQLAGRFQAEAQTQAKLRHPNIVSATDFVSSDNRLAIVMELVEGRSLEQEIKALGAGMPLSRIGDILLPVLDALSFAHGLGVVHRDIKPANIMLSQLGGRVVPKVMDFGIAKVFTAGGGNRTATGMLLGTLEYMSPEQCKESKNVDARSDLYALGVTLFEMATGRVPFKADSQFELMRCHLMEPPPDPRTLMPSMLDPLARIILRALEKDRDQRYQTAEAMAQEIRTVTQPQTPAPSAAVPATVALPAEQLPQMRMPNQGAYPPTPAPHQAAVVPPSGPGPAQHPGPRDFGQPGEASALGRLWSDYWLVIVTASIVGFLLLVVVMITVVIPALT